jgi:hypothetical protein
MAFRRLFNAGLLIVVLLVSACDSQAPGSTATAIIPPTAAVPTATSAEATRTVTQEVQMGFTEDGAPYRGDPNAPVTLLEFSEYL